MMVNAVENLGPVRAGGLVGVVLAGGEGRRMGPGVPKPLRLLAGPQRLETGWWDDSAQGPASRDYFIARSDEAGLLWVYRERLASRSDRDAQTAPVRWFLQGIYA